MNIALTPFLAGWLALACIVIGLAVYRRVIAHSEDEMLHVSEADSAHVSRQVEVAHRLEIVDRWGKVLTVIVALYGLLLAAAYGYQIWTEGSTTIPLG